MYHHDRAHPVARRLACAVLTLVLGCGPDAGDRPAREQPDVLIYAIDTLRADHLGVYGYGKNTSPRIDAFAADAIVFENAYAPSSWTRPSVASLLTGLYPTSHDVRTRVDRVQASVTLLSEILSGAGYRTAAIVTNPNIVSFWGFDQGFDRFDDIDAAHGEAQPDADAVTDRVLAYVSDATRPFLVYAHVLDPHGPYDPPAPFATRFGGGPGDVLEPSTMTRETPEATFRNQVARYDGEIGFTDEQFGRLIDGLVARDLYRDALIVVTADHGEELLEHGAGGHGHTLYEELVRIPLIIKLPGNAHAGQRVKARAGLIDVVPTVLAHVREVGPVTTDGIDVTSAVTSTAAIPERQLFLDLEQERFDGTLNIAQGVLGGPYKYIQVVSPEADELLFDLGKDPGELRNVRAAEDEVAGTLIHAVAVHASAGDRRVFPSVVNEGGAEKRTVEGRLTTDGRFVDLHATALEAGDLVDVEDDGSDLTFRLGLRNDPHPFGGRPKWIVDVDEIAFRVEPPDAAVVVERLVAGDDTVELFLGAARRQAESMPRSFRVSDPTLLVPDVGFVFSQDGRRIHSPAAGVYIGVVGITGEPVDAVEPEVSPELQERLQALGYVP
jgi:arylsulfatase A-like enzyme